MPAGPGGTLPLWPALTGRCGGVGKTFRHRLSPEYKQSRPPSPYFIPVLKHDLLAALAHIPVPVLEVIGSTEGGREAAEELSGGWWVGRWAEWKRTM